MLTGASTAASMSMGSMAPALRSTMDYLVVVGTLLIPAAAGCTASPGAACALGLHEESRPVKVVFDQMGAGSSARASGAGPSSLIRPRLCDDRAVF
jgi:hypothetical protein